MKSIEAFACASLDTHCFAVILPRSDNGVFPGQDQALDVSEQKTILIYETPIPTVQSPPSSATRVLEPQFDQERQGHAGKSPSRRSQAPDARVIMLAPQPRLRFGRGARIKQSRDFSRVRQEGQRMVCGCLIANWRPLPDASATRLGVVVSGKVGGSVVRSRVRRLLRETFRLHQHDLVQSLDLILVARNSIAGRGLRDVEKDFLLAMNRAKLIPGAGAEEKVESQK